LNAHKLNQWKLDKATRTNNMMAQLPNTHQFNNQEPLNYLVPFLKKKHDNTMMEVFNQN